MTDALLGLIVLLLGVNALVLWRKSPVSANPVTAVTTEKITHPRVVEFAIAERRVPESEKADDAFALSMPMPKAETPKLVMDYAVLKAELANDPLGLGYKTLGQDYQAIADVLNWQQAMEESNPAKQAEVPAPMTIFDLLGCITAEEALGVYQLPALKADVEDCVARSDRVSLAAIFTVVQTMFSPESQEAINKLLALTVPDPNWQPTVTVYADSRATLLGLPHVKPTDVQQVW